MSLKQLKVHQVNAHIRVQEVTNNDAGTITYTLQSNQFGTWYPKGEVIEFINKQ